MAEQGLDNFSFSVVEECSKEELLIKEQYYIKKYNSLCPNGYNMQIGLNFRKSFSEEIVDGIQQDLIKNELSRKQISEKWEVSPSYVSNVNSGKLRYNNLLSYPLRPIQHYFKEDCYCIDCGIKIHKGSKRCNKCATLLLRKVERPNREELKHLIRTLPFTQIGKMYGVSDNAVRKWCDFEKLPRKKKEINSYSNSEWKKI